MKAILSILSVSISMVILVSLVQPAYAVLINRGGGLIYDNDLNITWLQDANLGGKMTWDDASAWVDNLNFAGFDDWRFPKWEASINEIVHLFYDEGLSYQTLVNGSVLDPGPFIIPVNQEPIWWADEEWAPDVHFTFQPPTFFWNGFGDDWSPQMVWAVRDGDIPASVPEPSTIWLMVLGLSGILVLWTKIRQS